MPTITNESKNGEHHRFADEDARLVQPGTQRVHGR